MERRHLPPMQPCRRCHIVSNGVGPRGGAGISRWLVSLVAAVACVGVASGCIQMFDDADGPAARGGAADELNRAAKAPVIVVGVVEQAHKGFRDAHETYMIDFRIARVLKGRDIVISLPESPDAAAAARGVYRVSNFGSFRKCFSDVEENHTYVLFLQAFGVQQHRRLSAYYTRPADAAEPWSQELEERIILHAVGYKAWGEWSGCSASCGGGVLRRVRVCARDEGQMQCVGDNVEKKECNTFGCSGVKNLVDIGGLGRMAKGVIRYSGSGGSVNGGDQQQPQQQQQQPPPSSLLLHQQAQQQRPLYDITPNFYGQLPAALLYKPRWPAKYSLMVRVRPRETRYPRQGQYLLSLADAAGEQYIGLKLYPYPTLELRTASGAIEQIPVGSRLLKNGQRLANINDGGWHTFAFAVDGLAVTPYYGCIRRGEWKLRERPIAPPVHTSSVVLATRMFKMDRGSEDRFEGTIDQLVITEDPADAGRQCSTRFWGEKTATKAKNYPRQNDSPCTDADDEDCLGSGEGRVNSDDERSSTAEHWEWSAWSPCSRTCGTGKKTRTPYCLRNSVNRDDCIPYYVPAVHVKECVEQRRCPECNCQNGGVCVSDGECKCPKGWRGATCAQAVCTAGCGGNGDCVGPEMCECRNGWSGPRCEAPVCHLACQNGGVCVAPNLCRCPDGYGGPICTRTVRACPTPCQNGGRCVGLGKCECQPGYRGRYCQEKAEPVCNRLCLNGGSCSALGDKCSCPAGYQGEFCETDSCGGCRNGGRCDVATQRCSCQQGYAGIQCEYAVTPARCVGASQCQNGGLCIDFGSCYCPSGYHGQQCQIKKCSGYKTAKAVKEVSLRRPQYRYFRCPGSIVNLCKEFVGYVFEKRNVTSDAVDLTQCDD